MTEKAIKQQAVLVLFLFLILPNAARADAVVPLVYFFHKDTWLAASIYMLILILLESGILRLKVHRLRYLPVLWRTALVNLASSIAGSLLLLVFSSQHLFIDAAVPILFFLTLAVEIPILYVLFRTEAWSRARTLFFGGLINVASYIAVIVLQIGLSFVWSSYAKSLDAQELKEWNNPGLLQKATGRIYGTAGIDGTDRFRFAKGLLEYDVKKAQWKELPESPSLNVKVWDVEGGLIAFARSESDNGEKSGLMVCRLPDFAPQLEVLPAEFPAYQGTRPERPAAVALSPDRTKLAVLFWIDEAASPRTYYSYYSLGGKCRLVILDAASGKQRAHAGRWASDRGLCWLSDSQRILFSSLDDETLYQDEKVDSKGKRRHMLGYVSTGPFKSSLYVFDCQSGAVERFSDGYRPVRAGATDDVLIWTENSLQVVDSTGMLKKRLEEKRLVFGEAVLSPDGTMLMVEVALRSFHLFQSPLVLMNLNNPDTRHLLNEGLWHRIDWIAGGERKGD